MEKSTTLTRYTSVAIFLHWLMALLLIGMLALGWIMDSDLVPAGEMKKILYTTHKSTGLLILALAVLRLLWRLGHKPPPLPANTPIWQSVVAKLVHSMFYVLMIAIPLAGWALVSTGTWGIKLFGLLHVPNLPLPAVMQNSDEWREFFYETHEILAILLVVLIAAHIAAAIKHHFSRNGVLARII